MSGSLKHNSTRTFRFIEPEIIPINDAINPVGKILVPRPRTPSASLQYWVTGATHTGEALQPYPRFPLIRVDNGAKTSHLLLNELSPTHSDPGPFPTSSAAPFNGSSSHRNRRFFPAIQTTRAPPLSLETPAPSRNTNAMNMQRGRLYQKRKTEGTDRIK